MPRRTLRWRIIFGTAAMLAGTVGVGALGVAAVESLHADLSVASAGYEELRHVFGAGFMLSRARDALTSASPNAGQAAAALHAAAEELAGDEHSPDAAERLQCVLMLHAAEAEIRSNPSVPTASLGGLFARLAELSDEVRGRITEAQSAADSKRRTTVVTLACFCGMVTLSAIFIGIRQYRNVIGPVREIARGTRAFSSGEFDSRLTVAGDREFAAVASDFNAMADQLQSLYLNLESKVREKSRELVQSERLASVGFLAAGVAHEINNPLGIIAGFGERAQQLLRSGDDPKRLEKAASAINIICEETFRCSQIIQRLLSLAAPGSADRRVVSLTLICAEVISAAAGLNVVSAKKLSLSSEPGEDVSVKVVEGEIKQVVLNLVINAIEAIADNGGSVRLAVRRNDRDVQLTVADDGRGMTPATMEKVFEPFFTTGNSRRGIGLGLSIAHAIVTDHEGTLTASSDGPGRGSEFSMRLPSAEVRHAN